MTAFYKKIRSAIAQSGSYVCVGLDPDPQKLPVQFIRRSSDGIAIFLQEIIEATVPYAAAFKLNLAFYEALGVEGWRILKDVVQAIPPDRIKIADGKRGDIGNSARFYASAIFDDYHFDAATVNPYMGKDSIEHFIERSDKGIFILSLTSNPGAADFQFVGGKRKLFEVVAAKAVEWNTKQNIGLVTGASKPEYLLSLRKIAPDMPFLIPGIGAQGGDLKQVVKNALKGYSYGGIVNSSRGIIYASNQGDFAQAAADAAKELRDSINKMIA